MSASDSSSTLAKPALKRRPVQVIAVTSGKGGVGKTNVSANLAVALARQQREVLLLDADLGLANVDVLLGLQPRFNLADVIAGRASLDETLVYGPRGIRIVPAASGDRDMMDLTSREQAAIIRAFGELNYLPDIMVVDTAAGMSSGVVQFVRASHQVIVVVCDEPASLTDAYAIIKILSQNFGVRRFQIVTNMTKSAAEGRALFQKILTVADKYLEVILHHLGNVPYDAKLRKAVQEQLAVVESYPDSWSGRAFMTMAERIAGWPRPKAEDADGGISFFFETLLVGEPDDGDATV